MNETIKELMKQYNDNLLRWIEKYGDEDGFNHWFTKQVIDKQYLKMPTVSSRIRA